ncbi:MAG: hypothetical protein QNJ51_10345 [Calothrix sp. MO_167.B12]|nr:hypothetical protein [Calothrix sp. MO_167.B12]
MTPENPILLNGQEIYIRKENTQGKNLEDYELVKVQIELPEEIQFNLVEENVIGNKRSRLLSKSKFNFHYLDGVTIDNYYRSDVALTINQVAEKIIVEATSQVNGGLEIDTASAVKAMLRKESMLRTISEVRLEELNKYQQFPIVHKTKLDEDEVDLSLELEAGLSDELVKFDNAINILKLYNINFEVEQVSKQRQNLGKEMIDNIFNRSMKSKYQSVIVSGQFRIEDADENYYLVLLHPICKRISQLQLKIIAVVPKDRIEEAWKHMYMPGEEINTNVFGDIARHKSDESLGKWEIFLNPAAIYS